MSSLIVNVAKDLDIKEIGQNVSDEDDSSQDTFLNDNDERLSPFKDDDHLGDNIESGFRHKQQTEEVFNFNQKVGVEVGNITANNDGKLVCDICQQSYSTKGNLMVHRLKHDGVKFPCKQCEYQAKQLSDLTTHVKAKHEGVRYPCQQCDYKASTTSNLARHNRSNHST